MGTHMALARTETPGPAALAWSYRTAGLYYGIGIGSLGLQITASTVCAPCASLLTAARMCACRLQLDRTSTPEEKPGAADTVGALVFASLALAK